MNAPDPATRAADEKRAGQRFALMNALRFGSLIAVMAGIAGAQNAIPLPYALSVILALAGVAGFFFGPPLLARRFKAADALRKS